MTSKKGLIEDSRQTQANRILNHHSKKHIHHRIANGAVQTGIAKQTLIIAPSQFKAQSQKTDAFANPFSFGLAGDGRAAALHIGKADAQRPGQRKDGQSQQDQYGWAKKYPLHQFVFAHGALALPGKGGQARAR